MSVNSTVSSKAGSTAGTSIRHAVIGSPVGELTLVRDDAGLTGLYFPGHWTHPDPASFGPRVQPAEDRGFDQPITQLIEYFAGRRREFDLPLTLHGSRRSRQVWRLLTEIPYGRTISYGTLAEQVGDGVGARAIGMFVGHNPLSIFIPCHRVVGANGALTGYAGGLERKQRLLELEGARQPAITPLW
jgi:methylated-DNA-[protein]-cysteine S-methyltransferase